MERKVVSESNGYDVIEVQTKSGKVRYKRYNQLDALIQDETSERILTYYNRCLHYDTLNQLRRHEGVVSLGTGIRHLPPETRQKVKAEINCLIEKYRKEVKVSPLKKVLRKLRNLTKKLLG